MKPRNTLVIVAELKKAEEKIGEIVVPTATEREYKRCEVISVGPGMITSKDELSPCQDLQPGQIVLVKLHRTARIDHQTCSLEPIGVGFQTEDGRALTLVEQSQIVAIFENTDKQEIIHG